MSDHIEHACPSCGSFPHYDCTTPRPEVAPDFDPIGGPLIPGDRWNGTAGGPTPTLSEAVYDGPLPPGCVASKIGESVLEVMAPPAPGEWKIADLSELDRVLARMARLKRLQSENREVVEAEQERALEWLAKENDALEKRYRDLEAHVRVFVEANRETLGRYRNLPHGRVEWKRRKEGAYRLDPNMTDYAARKELLEWARKEETTRSDWRFPEPLVVDGPAVVDLEQVKEYLSEISADGERKSAPGLEWVPPGETLTISVEEKKR